MDSKYEMIKTKPSPVVFTVKNGPSSPKKIKLTDKKENVIPNSSKPKPNISIQEQRRRLPIFTHRNKLLDLIRRHETLVVLAETGSGKTTQIPQYILSARLNNSAKIGITQPRRMAAISIAMRVAKEIGNGVSLCLFILNIIQLLVHFVKFSEFPLKI